MILKFAAFFTTFYQAANAAAALSGLGGLNATTGQLLGNLDANNNKLTNLANGSAAGDSVNLGQVQALVNNLDFKDSVRVATTANITLSGTQTIDGVSVIAGDRVLVKDQTTGSENGIYVCAAGAWSRSTDCDASAEVTAGMTVTVTEGTANGDKAWRLTTNDAIVLGTTSLTFTVLPGVALDSVSNPQALGTAAAGNSSQASPANHVHPTTGLMLLAGGTMTGPISHAGAIYPPVNKSADFTPGGAEDVFVVDKSGGNVTATLPPATGSGRVYTFIVATGASNTFTVDGNGAETVRNDAGSDVASMPIALGEARKFIDAASGVWLQCP